MWLLASPLVVLCSVALADRPAPAISVGQKVVTVGDPPPVVLDGRVIDDGRSFRVYTVEKIEDENALVVSNGLRGYVPKRSLIPFDSAIEYWTRKLSTDPTAEGFVHRGVVWEEKGEYEKAVRDYNEAIRLDPACVAAFKNRGLRRLHAGDHRRAVEDFVTAIRLDPSDGNSYYNRAYAREAVGDLDGAIDDLGRAIKLSAQPADSYVRRGIAWEGKGEHRKALDDFAKALESDPDNVWALNGVGWISSTCLEAPLRDGAKAVKSATRACELSGWRDAIFLGTLAAAHAEAGDFDRAVEYQEKASKLYTDEANRKPGEERLRRYRMKKPYREGR